MKKLGLFILVCSLPLCAQTKRKKYDLGALQVEGKAVVPRDLTVIDAVDFSKLNIFERKNYKKEIQKEFKRNFNYLRGKR